MKSFRILLIALASLVACDTPLETDNQSIDLEEGFLQPPESAKPWTWWHWADGNITREGISSDLEAMSRAGLGGVLIFNARLGLPDGPVRFMSDEWLGMLDHTAEECERLGLKLGIHNCDGWSQAGGPWITPEQSMKTLTWTKSRVEGPGKFSGTLPRPAIPESPYVKGFYRDIAVLAYPVPEGERINGPGSGIQLKGSLPASDLKALTDGSKESHAVFPLGSAANPLYQHVDMHFQGEVAARSLIIHGIEGHTLPQVIPGKLEVSENGEDFREVASFELNWSYHGSPIHTLSVAFPETSAKIFRFSLQGEHVFMPALGVSELELSTRPVLHYREVKAGWAVTREHGGEAPSLKRDPGPGATDLSLPSGGIIPLDQVQVLSLKNSEDGSLEWEIPGGRWELLRMGYTSTGKTNSPATEEGRGLEADKLDRDAVNYHMDQFIGKLKERYNDSELNSFQIFETDSWESGPQTWTEGLDERFVSATGQDLLRWLPLLTEGVIIEGYEQSDRLLWEWRRFMADQIAENYYQVTADFAAEHGLTYVSESSGRQMFMYDPITYQRISPVPMGEFWVSKARGQGVRVDNRVAASAAHLDGKKFVASEAYTSPPESARWIQHPFTLKALGDLAFCEGVNKIVFHTYAHQPYPDLKPGFSMGRWGMQNMQGNTWWDGPVEAWLAYIARCQFMLQEGRFHADILAYLGEEVPSRLGRRDEFTPAIPSGYDYDGCDVQALMEIRVEKGELVMPSGMRYRALLLPEKQKMSTGVARRIAQLVDQGALLITPVIPESSPRFMEMGDGDRELQDLVEAYWKSGKIHLVKAELENFLSNKGLPPDFSYQAEQAANIRFIHRSIGDYQVYFLSSQENHPLSIRATFRQDPGMGITFWDPATGMKRSAGEGLDKGKPGIELKVDLDANGSVFVVFSQREVETLPELKEEHREAFQRTWTLEFPEGKGAPGEVMELEELIDISGHEAFGIRHFSGTMTYRSSLVVGESNITGGKHVMLDLGEVREMAEVQVNGKRAEILWKPPFRTDISSLLRPGENELEVRVTNLWVNRMIGDARFPEDLVWKDGAGTGIVKQWPGWLLSGEERPATERISWSTRKDYSKDDPLLPSGLIGPVQLIFAMEN